MVNFLRRKTLVSLYCSHLFPLRNKALKSRLLRRLPTIQRTPKVLSLGAKTSFDTRLPIRTRVVVVHGVFYKQSEAFCLILCTGDVLVDNCGVVMLVNGQYWPHNNVATLDPEVGLPTISYFVAQSLQSHIGGLLPISWCVPSWDSNCLIIACSMLTQL